MSNLAVVSADNGNLRMETETISKNGASSKSHTSRRNFLRNTCIAFFAAGIILSGCGKDKDAPGQGESTTVFEGGTLTVTMEVDKYYEAVKSIKAYAIVYDNTVQGNVKQVEIASAPFSEGFTLNLPASPADQFLWNIFSFYPQSDYTVEYEGATPRIAEVSQFMAFNSAGNHVFELAHGIFSENNVVNFWYVNKDVKITGSKDNTTCDVTLKQGWNRVYLKWEGTTATPILKITSTIPSGVGWYFFEYVK